MTPPRFRIVVTSRYPEYGPTKNLYTALVGIYTVSLYTVSLYTVSFYTGYAAGTCSRASSTSWDTGKVH